ncbi:MAG: dihydroorotase [Lachnospiraceae bacterium]|nr:dihydroorotase [Lachnospiraceae bacterium]
MKALIKNGMVIDPANSVKEKKDILIENSIIKLIKKKIDEEADYVIDAKGLIVSPGFVDLHANFCDPGATDREDLKSGSLSAAKGGYTHVVLGVDNKPAPSECNVIDYITRYASIMPTNIYASAAITEERLGMEPSDINFLYSHGAFAFYDGLRAVEDKTLLSKIMEEVKNKNKVLSIFSGTSDDKYVKGISEGSVAKKLKIKNPTPLDAEANDLKDNIALAKLMGVKLDLAYISSAESIEIVEKAKDDDQVIYAEVPALNLILTDKALEKYGTNAKVIPALRSETDRVSLCKALKKGIIDVISSNHVPIEKKEKNEKLKDAPSGAIGLETVLGICGLKLVGDNYLNWKEVIEKISTNPAKVFDLDKEGVGSITEGKKANITIFDPNEKWIFEEESIISKSHNSPLIGMELVGKVRYTICNGRLVYRSVETEK